MSSFKRPKSNVYKRFLYIDENEVLNSLSSIEGGAIDEVLRKISDEGGSGFSAEIGASLPSAASVKAGGNKKKSQRLEEEIVRKRTLHSATATLLEKLHKEEAVGVIEGSYTPEIYEEFEENMPLQLEAEIRIHPLHQLVSVVQGWAEMARNFGIDKREANEFTSIARQVEAAFHGKDKSGKTIMVFAEAEKTDPNYRFALPINTDNLLVPLDEFSGRATFVTQVDNIIDSDEEVLAARVVRNSPVLPAERDMMLEMLPAFKELEDESGIGLKISREDIVLSKPTVILKPICIYR